MNKEIELKLKKLNITLEEAKKIYAILGEIIPDDPELIGLKIIRNMEWSLFPHYTADELTQIFDKYGYDKVINFKKEIEKEFWEQQNRIMNRIMKRKKTGMEVSMERIIEIENKKFTEILKALKDIKDTFIKIDKILDKKNK